MGFRMKYRVILLLALGLLLVACERPFQSDGTVAEAPAQQPEEAAIEPSNNAGEEGDTEAPAVEENNEAGAETTESEAPAEGDGASAEEGETSDNTPATTEDDGSTEEPAPSSEEDNGSDESGSDESGSDESGSDESGEKAPATEDEAPKEGDDASSTEDDDATESDEAETTTEEPSDDSTDDGAGAVGENPSTHTVADGDTLYKIGLEYGVSWVALAEHNNLSNANRLDVGQVLNIPGAEADAEPTPSPQTEETYTVKPGDNLFRIGLAHDVGWQQIAEANGIVNPNQLLVGQQIKIPMETDGPSPQFAHLVRAGQTLFSISVQYGVSWTAVAEANDIESPYVIFTGQTIVIPGG